MLFLTTFSEPCIIVIDFILQESDKEERVCEALASMLTKSFADYSGLANDQVYNPKEVRIVDLASVWMLFK